MSMTPAWPLLTTRGPPRRVDNLLDTTCFSTSDFDNFEDFNFDNFVSQDHSLPSMSNLATADYHEHATEILRIKALSNGELNVEARSIIPPSLMRLSLLLLFNKVVSKSTSQTNFLT